MEPRKTGGKRKRDNPEEISDVMIDDKEDFFEMEPENFERQFEFEVNEVDFEFDRGGIEHFTSSLLPNMNTYELVPVILGDPKEEVPNPLTSVVKVNHQSALPDPRESGPEEEAAEEAGDIPMVDSKDWEWKRDVYGFVTLIDLPKHQNLRFTGEIKQYVLNLSPDEDSKKKAGLLINDLTGWIINCHVTNLPFQLSSMLHENLLKETKREIDKKSITFFKNFMIIAKAYKLVKSAQRFEHKNKKMKGTLTFCNEEEEFYFRNATYSFLSPINNEFSYDQNSPQLNENVKFYNVVIFFSRERFNNIITAMKKSLNKDSFKMDSFKM